MHLMIEAPGDVIALRVSGKITGADLGAIMDRLDGSMAAHDKVHVFVETKGIEGIELSGLPSYCSAQSRCSGSSTGSAGSRWLPTRDGSGQGRA